MITQRERVETGHTIRACRLREQRRWSKGAFDSYLLFPAKASMLSFLAVALAQIFTDAVIPDIIKMISLNMFRALPPANEEFDPDEDEPSLEPSWPHLQVVYEFFLRFIVSAEVKAKSAKKFIDQSFCSKVSLVLAPLRRLPCAGLGVLLSPCAFPLSLQLIDLFDTEDPREREYLKTILHRIYGGAASIRTFPSVFFCFLIAPAIVQASLCPCDRSFGRLSGMYSSGSCTKRRSTTASASCSRFSDPLSTASRSP